MKEIILKKTYSLFKISSVNYYKLAEVNTKYVQYKDKQGNFQFVFQIIQSGKDQIKKCKVFAKNKLQAIKQIKNKYNNCKFYKIYQVKVLINTNTRTYVKDQFGRLNKSLVRI